MSTFIHGGREAGAAPKTADAPARHSDDAPVLDDRRPASAQLRQLRRDVADSPVAQRHAALQGLANAGAAAPPPVANRTGLPDRLKSGIERLSGHSLDDVKVHYNSARPAALQAHAYAQGSDIHIAPGQEKHLPHEAWHVVQQKQGRVRATMRMQAGAAINDDPVLEREADVMGTHALRRTPVAQSALVQASAAGRKKEVAQRVIDGFYLPENCKIPRERIHFNENFQVKHFADDAAAALVVTTARVATGAPPGIMNGTIANTTATEAEWMDAVDNSVTAVPDQANWVGNIVVKINGWSTKYAALAYTTLPLAAAARRVGGILTIKGGNLTVDHVGN